MKAFALLASLALAGCVDPQPDPAVLPVADVCGAQALQGLVGQPRKVLETMKFGGPVRVIEPGMAVTMDYLAGRLNIWLNDAGRIDRVTCG